MDKWILASSIGTSGVKTILYHQDGTILRSRFDTYPTSFLPGNWVEQNPLDWWRSFTGGVNHILRNMDSHKIGAVSFSGQMMGCVCMDHNGYPLRDAIIWADRRSRKEADELHENISMEKFYEITGHRLSASYSLEKLLWIRNNQPEVYKATCKMLNPKDYLVFKLTGVMATDYSDASGTNIFNIRKKQWSETILSISGLEREKLPDPFPSTHVIGEVSLEAAAETGLNPGTPVVIGGGDAVTSAIGSGAIEDDQAFGYLGSSSWIAMNTTQPIFDPQMRTFNWIHCLPDRYIPCGTMQAAATSLQWLLDEICLSEKEQSMVQRRNPYEILDLEASLSMRGAQGLIFLPYLMGERSPFWEPDARGSFIGLKRDHHREDIIRSVMEGVFMNMRLILDAFTENNRPISVFSATGSLASSGFRRSLLASILNVQVSLSRHYEDSKTFGAALIGGVGSGIYKDFSIVKQIDPSDEAVVSDKDDAAFYNSLLPVFVSAFRNLQAINKSLSELGKG